LIVRATTIVGRSVLAAASVKAASIASMSWPSISIVCQPEAAARPE
jgi:hypothetical protein